MDEAGKVRPYVFQAQERGIVFDVGHGGGSFVFEQAVPAMEQGLKPQYHQHRLTYRKHEWRDEKSAECDV